MLSIAELTSRFTKAGKVSWIGVRPARRTDVIPLNEVHVTADGLEGDHYQSGGKRTVTLIQHEHLAVIGSFIGRESVNPELLRRNIVVSGINLIGLKNRKFKIGNVTLEGSGLCAPCSRMEEYLGEGGYSAVRGHGGITARVLDGGMVRLGDQIYPL